jgi:hypothetical protein
MGHIPDLGAPIMQLSGSRLTQKNHRRRWDLSLQLLVEHEEMVEFVKLGSDKKSPVVERGEGTSFVKLPLIVVRLSDSRPTAI